LNIFLKNKKMKSFIRNCLLFLLILIGTACLALFQDANKFNDAELAREYAPEFWFAQDEQYYPCDYSLFFFDKDKNEIPGELAKQKYDGLSFEDKLKNFKIFYNIDKSDPNQTIIQYWTIYVFNNFSNQHYGDIEGTTVFVDNETGQINKIIGNAHFGTYSKIIAANNQADNIKQSHVIVLVEQGSHASCPDPNGDGQISPKELSNWYNAYGISSWTNYDSIYGAKMSYDDPNYRLAPLSELEDKMKGLETLQKSPQLGWSIITQGNFFGLNFYQEISTPLGGDSLNLNNINSIKDNPNTVAPITFQMIAEAINQWFEILKNNLERFFGLNQNEQETAQLIEDLVPATTTIPTSTKSTTSPTVAGLSDQNHEEIEKLPSPKPVVPKQKSQKEIDKELREIQKKLNQIKKEVEKLEKQAELAKKKQEKEIQKQVKGAQTQAQKSLPTILISKVASGIDNADNEFLELYNPGDQPIEINSNNLKIIFYNSNGATTTKNIKFKNNIIPAKGSFLLSTKIGEYDASFSSGIVQTGGIILQDKTNKLLDKVAWGSNPPSEAVWGQGYYLQNGLKTNSCLVRKSEGFTLQNSQNNQADFSVLHNFWFQDSLGNKIFYSFPTIEENSGSVSSPIIANRHIVYPILINEIMYNASGTDTGHEWIELYNSGNATATISDWKINESNSNHKLALVSGASDLVPKGFTILANDPNKFLTDFPQYSGSLFKTSIALNNISEIIILLDEVGEVDRAYYTSSTGAYDNGNSLQLINNQWVESWPTPGMPNILSLVSPTTTPTTTDATSTATTTDPFASTTPELTTSTPTTTPTTTQTLATSTANTLVINEIAWAGTNASPDDEWLELYNYGTTTVNLLGWKIDQNATSFIELIDFNLEPDSYFLLERTNDQTISDIIANQIYTGALSNEGEKLELINPNQEIIDLIDCSTGWFYGTNNGSGSSTARLSMERISATSTGNSSSTWKNYNIAWHRIAHDANGQDILGTPKQKNSPILIPTNSEPDDPDLLNDFLNETEPTSTATTTPTTTPEIMSTTTPDITPTSTPEIIDPITTSTPEIIPTSTQEFLETSTATTTI